MHKAARFYHEIFITHATYREFMLGLAALPVLPLALRDILSNIYDHYKLRSLPLCSYFSPLSANRAISLRTTQMKKRADHASL